jgi:hypothetical protein
LISGCACGRFKGDLASENCQFKSGKYRDRLVSPPILASPAWKRHLGGKGREKRLKSIVCDSEGMASRGVMRRVLLGDDASDKGVTRRFCPNGDGRAGVRGATGDTATASRPDRDCDEAGGGAIPEVIEMPGVIEILEVIEM